jgi:hypothetical protein
VNKSRTTCLLSGSPKLSAVRDGKRTTLLATPHDAFFGALDPTDLKPGGFTLLRLHTSTSCKKPEEKLTGLQILLPDGGALDAPSVGLHDQCGLAVSDFGVPRRVQQHVAKPGTASVLKATLDVPSSVEAGTTLAYSVTLTNPTNRTVTLKPCPGYTQGIFAQGYAISLAYQLNCGTVTTIPANGAVAYDMSLDLPSSKDAVDAKLAWGLNMPVGPYASTPIRVNAG